MAKMSTYGNDSAISLTDRLFGVDAEDTNSTKNYVVSELITFIGNNLPASVLQADNISYDNTASILLATDVQAAIDELDDDIEIVDDSLSALTSVVGDNASDISTNASDISTNASDISTNASGIIANAGNISSLDASKRNIINPGTTLVTDFNLSTLTADEYVVNDGGGTVNIFVDDLAGDPLNPVIGLFENRWLHIIVSGAGVSISGTGSQTVLGTTNITSTGSHRITNIGSSTWMVL